MSSQQYIQREIRKIPLYKKEILIADWLVSSKVYKDQEVMVMED